MRNIINKITEKCGKCISYLRFDDTNPHFQLRLLLTAAVIIAVLQIFCVSAINLDNVTIPDFNYGTYTQYWFHPNTTEFDGFGFAYSLVAPFTTLLGAWFFVIMWSAIIYRSYERTGNITMPIVLGLLTSTVWGVLIPQEAIMVWTVMFGIGIAALVAKYMLDR